MGPRGSGRKAGSLTCTLQSWCRLDVPAQVLLPAPGTDLPLAGRGAEPELEPELQAQHPFRRATASTPRSHSP